MSRKLRLLQILRDAGDRGVTNTELVLAGVGYRYSARLYDLRDVGYVIETERLGDGVVRYRLLHEPEFAHPRPQELEASPEPEAEQPSLFEVPAASRSAISGWEAA